MSSRTFLIGIGAAGNKAVIETVKSGVILEEDMFLINTTGRDIPENYKEKALILDGGNNLGGCGKEPKLGENKVLEAIKSQNLNLKSVIEPQHTSVTVVASAEGGTGCGGAPVIARYVADVLKLPVHLIFFLGFREDGRGLQNTVRMFQQVRANFDVQIIDNSKFLEEANGNQRVAEHLANNELACRLSVMLGNVIRESEQNIDDMDLYKVVNTLGFKEIVYREVSEKIKTKEQFESIIKEMMVNSKSVDVETASMQRMAGIFNLSESDMENVDVSLSKVKEKYGEPFEYFKHIEYVEDLPKFIAFICSGFKIPINIVEELNDEYIEKSSKVSKDEDSYFDKVSRLESLEEDKRFDSASNIRTSEGSEDDFFASYN